MPRSHAVPQPPRTHVVLTVEEARALGPALPGHLGLLLVHGARGPVASDGLAPGVAGFAVRRSLRWKTAASSVRPSRRYVSPVPCQARASRLRSPSRRSSVAERL